MPSAQKRVVRREFAGDRNILYKTYVHGHVAVAALSGVIRAIGIMQHVRVQQYGREHERRENTRPHRGAVHVPHGLQAVPCFPQPYQEHGGDRCRRDHRRQAKTERGGKSRRQQCKKRHARTAAKRHIHRRPRIRQHPANCKHARGNKDKYV